MLISFLFASLVMNESKFDSDSNLVEWCKAIYENICTNPPMQ